MLGTGADGLSCRALESVVATDVNCHACIDSGREDGDVDLDVDVDGVVVCVCDILEVFVSLELCGYIGFSK